MYLPLFCYLMAPAFPQGSAVEGDVQIRSPLTSGEHRHPKGAHFISDLFFLVSDLFFCCQRLSSAPLTCLFQLGFSPPMHRLLELTSAIAGSSGARITEGPRLFISNSSWDFHLPGVTALLLSCYVEGQTCKSRRCLKSV